MKYEHHSVGPFATNNGLYLYRIYRRPQDDFADPDKFDTDGLYVYNNNEILCHVLQRTGEDVITLRNRTVQVCTILDAGTEALQGIDAPLL